MAHVVALVNPEQLWLLYTRSEGQHLTWAGIGSWTPTLVWRTVGGWWLLGEGEPGLLKGVAPGRWISSINNSTSTSVQAAQIKVDGWLFSLKSQWGEEGSGRSYRKELGVNLVKIHCKKFWEEINKNILNKNNNNKFKPDRGWDAACCTSIRTSVENLSVATDFCMWA